MVGAKAKIFRKFAMHALWLTLTFAGTAEARKTNQPIYEDPFDIGGGGASLTMASSEGRMFSNPAQLPYGGNFHRWVGYTFTIISNPDSVPLVIQGSNTVGGKGDSEEEEEPRDMDDFFQELQESPIHLGYGFALSWMTNNFGFAVFSRAEGRFGAKEYGLAGTPEFQLNLESYHGVATSLAARSPWRWLSFGVTPKYLYAGELYHSSDVYDAEGLNSLTEHPLVTGPKENHSAGTGFDIGALIFAQGDNVDWKLALKVDDVGGTKLSKDTPSEFKQVVSAGTSLSFHTGADIIHFAVDYRDILGAYMQEVDETKKEEMFKKIYMGTKITIRTYIGLSAGYYHGYPSYGFELDLLLVRVAATMYTREYGDHPGVSPSKLYMLNVSSGI